MRARAFVLVLLLSTTAGAFTLVSAEDEITGGLEGGRRTSDQFQQAQNRLERLPPAEPMPRHYSGGCQSSEGSHGSAT
jgi:hypothetical protein